MKVLLDTNFIISCIRKKIDFISQLEGQGFSVVVPIEVMHELKDLKKSIKESHPDRMAIDVAFELFEKRKVKKMSLGGTAIRKTHIDAALISKGKDGYYIATLDNEIKRSVPNKVVILNAKNEVGVERT